MKLKTIIAVLTTTLVLTGCSTFKKEQPVKVEYVKPYIPGELLINIVVPKPNITPEEYIKLPYNKREKFLFDMNVELYKVLNETNIRLTTLREILADVPEKTKE